MLTPNDCKMLDNCDIDALEKLVDKAIKEQHGWYDWEEALIDDDLSIDVRNKLAKRYVNSGWEYVYHQTSLENGERPGLTSFVFSMTPVKHFEKDTWHRIQR